ncbi:gag protease polyprotein [Cucumis melo var. makuwa]|uniref:Gag protease polyprotein n=1 Tax=Cucumis melo var. makuwa TaxID=1194695 RepID=A0A5D3DF35_CUCMM|nr:gag protease polyprotein [Cucumis melo var. makuwa]TYK22301.1 gag protease polyprotein [Cucumis melo var. makuwa]
MDSLSMDSIEGHNQVSGKGFPTTGPRIEVGNVVIHRGLYSIVRILAMELCLGRTSVTKLQYERCWSVTVVDRLVWTEGITRLICVSFGITRLIDVSFGVTRLIHLSFGITRLIRASSKITRLMCAFYGTTKLFMLGYSEGQTDEGQEGCVKAIWTRLVFFMLPLMEMPPRRGARRGGRGGRGRGAGRVQLEVQPGVQATDPAAPVTHADLAAMEQRFRDIIMQMREQQQPVSPAPAPAPTPSSIVPQIVPE